MTTYRTRLVFLLTILCVFLTPTSGNAWDGNRNGFILGFGLGVGANSSDGVDFVGFSTDLTVGFAPNDHWSMYYTGKASAAPSGDLSQFQIMPMLGVTWFASPTTPSYFLCGGLGVVGLSNADLGGEGGFGGFFGAGFEFARHFSVQADVAPYGWAGGAGLTGIIRLHVLGY